MAWYAVTSVSIHQLPPLSDLLSGAKDADSERPWMAKTSNCSWNRLVNLKNPAMIASHKSDGSAANSASWCQRVHQGANMRCTKGAPSLSCGGPASKKWTFASLVCCCCLAVHCSGLGVHFWLAGSTIALSIVIHSILCWWLCWSVSDWQFIIYMWLSHMCLCMFTVYRDMCAYQCYVVYICAFCAFMCIWLPWCAPNNCSTHNWCALV